MLVIPCKPRNLFLHHHNSSPRQNLSIFNSLTFSVNISCRLLPKGNVIMSFTYQQVLRGRRAFCRILFPWYFSFSTSWFSSRKNYHWNPVMLLVHSIDLCFRQIQGVCRWGLFKDQLILLLFPWHRYILPTLHCLVTK